eukprot:Gb_31278 [translate_table: standard]
MEDVKGLSKNSVEHPITLPSDISQGSAPVSLTIGAVSYANIKGTDQQNLEEKIEEDEDNQEKHSGIDVEDLMTMIKDAEKNVLLINEVRIHSLEELEQVRTEKEALQREVNLLQMRLAEANARLKLATKKSSKSELLEGELVSLERNMAESGIVCEGLADMEAEYRALHEHTEALKSHINSSTAIVAEFDALKIESDSYKEEIKVLQLKLAEHEEKIQCISQIEKDRSSLEEFIKVLEFKLDIAGKTVSELATVKAEYDALRKKVSSLQTGLEKSSQGFVLPNGVLITNQVLQEKIGRLEAALKQAEVDKGLLEQTREENELLREQVESLEVRLLESDQGIRSQLQVYQEEVEAFQTNLEQLKKESKMQNSDEPVQELPWEFWSNLLLSLDGWMLEKKMTPEDVNVLRDKAWRRDGDIQDAYTGCQGKSENIMIANLLKLTKARVRPGLHIVHIAAEMAPVAKVGGLGDVVTGLGKAFQRKGHLVEVFLPKYDCIDYSQIKNMKVLDMQINSYFDGRLFKNKIWMGVVDGLPVYFIEPHHPARFFWRGQFYGENDDFKRFTFFSRAALEFLLQAGKRPDVIHCHDWQTACVAPLYWDIYAPQGLNSARIAFTCHNFEYQGKETPASLASCGLDVQQQHRLDRMQDNLSHDKINAVKGGIVFSNIVTTVSPTYAEEVCSPEGGWGLHLTLAAHSKKFYGILNGIDTEAWNPSTDVLLDFQYSVDDLNGKAANKEALRKFLGLAVVGAAMPLVGCITRLVPQKGIHLIQRAIYQTLEYGGQFVLLGSSPIPQIQREFEAIANNFCGHPHIRLVLKYDEALSHCIYAASDIFIIPSIFEPCGLTQMIAMRYGSIPVARKTGGLNDSVFDVDDKTIPLLKRNGFTFSSADEQGVHSALYRAISYYKQKPEWWLELVKKTMKMNYSWDSSAARYEELYEKSVARARERTGKVHILSSIH